LTRAEIIRFIRANNCAVQASVSVSGAPQAAVIGIAVSDKLEIVFDTLASTRKAQNLVRNPRISLAIGGWIPGDERTLQIDGVADQPQGAELERLTALYYESFPSGRERLSWPGLTYFRVRPTWVRYRDFGARPPLEVVLGAAELE